MADQSIAMEDFTPQEHQNVIEWLKDNNDLDPGHVFNALGQAPGYGGWKKKAELEPGFLDELGLQFGIKTQKVKERERLQQTQEQLKPFVSALLSLKAQRLEAERYMPQNTGQAQDVLRTLGIAPGGEPQPFGQQPSTGLQPAPSMGDPAMSGMPLGASSAQAAAMPQIGPPDDPRAQPLSDGGRFMTPDAAMTTPIPLGQQAQQFDYQGRPIPPTAQPDLIPQPIRAEPIAAPLQRQAPTRPAVRNLEPFEMKAASDMLHAKATGHLVPGPDGRLVPYHPEAQLLNAPQQQELSDIFAGGRPSGRVPLPAAPLMQALKGKTESKGQEITAPVREYMKAHNLDPNISEHVEMARQGVRGEKVADEKGAIQFKESLQAGSQKTRDFLYSKTGKKFLVEATPQEVEQAIKDATDNDISEAARKAMDAFNLGGLDSTEKEKLSGLQQILHVTDRLKNEFTPAERREFVGYFQLPVNRLSQIIQANPRFAKFDALVNREGIAAFETGGKALTAQEAAIIFGFLPNAKEWSPENFEAKLLEADDYGRSKIHTIVNLATSNRKDVGRKMDAAMPKQGAGQATVKSDEDYNKLPSGTLFISPDGKTRRKP